MSELEWWQYPVSVKETTNIPEIIEWLKKNVGPHAIEWIVDFGPHNDQKRFLFKKEKTAMWVALIWS